MTQVTAEEILPGIYRIPVPLSGNPLKELNSYCIRGERNLLVDTGFRTEECRTAVEEGLQSVGISMENTDILLTHLHADHSGSAPDLIRPGNRVYLSRTDIAYMKRGQLAAGGHELHQLQKERLLRHGISRSLADEMMETTPSRKLAGRAGFSDYTPLDEGDVLEAGEYRLKAISTPGHTPGHMCFSVVGTGAMITGDHVLFDISPNITNWADVEDSLGDYLKSLDKIDQYTVTVPLPGHRKPGDFHQRIRELKEHHRVRLEECQNVIKGLGKACLYDIAGGMSWRIRAADWDSFPAAQRWFALGECLAHIDHLVLEGRVRRVETSGGIYYEA
ncbi:MAG: MBL fold metallo-hydrolase [Eubacteriales bacterium]|nr:MBL fold metallo-hydrolase [Eubacteriales bacterium]